MQIPPRYQLTKKVTSLLATFEACKEVINAVNVPAELIANYRIKAILGSALYSARIEGNRLTRAEVNSFSDLSVKDKSRTEIVNLYRAIDLISGKFDRKKMITREDILAWQGMAMQNIIGEEYCGRFRTSHEGIFDAAGNVIYHAPSPAQVSGLIEDLLAYVNGANDDPIPVKAVLSHLAFEKIHPFVDGSGRTGRLFQMAILSGGGYGMKGLVVVEEIIDKNRQQYYLAIEDSLVDGTSFLELILEFLVEAAGSAKELILRGKGQEVSPLDLLLPRRREIWEIIREHGMVSFDFLHRRFAAVSPSSLADDLRHLVRAGLIIKMGGTRGAMYKVRG